MKPGMFGSMPSAMTATVTPVPVTGLPWPSRTLCACGVDGSRKAVFVIWSASGSSVLHSEAALIVLPPATARGLPAGPTGFARRGFGMARSGTTARISGFAVSVSISSCDRRAAKPFTVWNERTRRTLRVCSSATNGAWEVAIAAARLRAVLRSTLSSVS